MERAPTATSSKLGPNLHSGMLISIFEFLNSLAGPRGNVLLAPANHPLAVKSRVPVMRECHRRAPVLMPRPVRALARLRTVVYTEAKFLTRAAD